MIIALFPGSFDPPTYGHLNVIERASSIFDRIDVLVSVNQAKKYLFTPEERIEMLKEIVKPFSNVTVHSTDNLVVNYAKEIGAKVLLRGIRNEADFSFEFDLSLLNRTLNNEVETFFMPTEQKYFTVRSSAIKEIASYGGDVSAMVPPVVAERIKNKFPAK